MPRRVGILLQAWTAAQRIEQLVTRELEAAGASTPRYALLSMIRIREPITPTALAREMGLALTTLTDGLGELFELGHIERTANPSDGRSYLIRTTAEGHRAVKRAAPVLGRLHDDVEGRLSRPLDEIQAAIDELTRALEAVLATGSSGSYSVARNRPTSARDRR
jgi:MarR family transcriptional regulator, lower aerobic nicotinate degradation pathway regulator